MRKCLVTPNVSFLAGLAAFARLCMALPGWAAAGACHSVLLSWSGAEERFARIPAERCVRLLVIPRNGGSGVTGVDDKDRDSALSGHDKAETR